MNEDIMKLVNVYGLLSQMSMLKHEMNDYDWGWYPDELHEPIRAFYMELLKITGTLCEWLDPRLYTGNCASSCASSCIISCASKG